MRFASIDILDALCEGLDVPQPSPAHDYEMLARQLYAVLRGPVVYSALNAATRKALVETTYRPLTSVEGAATTTLELSPLSTEAAVRTGSLTASAAATRACAAHIRAVWEQYDNLEPLALLLEAAWQSGREYSPAPLIDAIRTVLPD
jgi:hypothetical protein